VARLKRSSSRIDWFALQRAQAARFWAKVDKSGDCWIWTAGKDKDGYGKFAITAPRGYRPKQRHVRAHRVAWELLHRRPSPRGKVSRHTCNTPMCVRHVVPGTQAENRRDCVNAGNQPRGEASAKAKLTEAQVRKMKMMIVARRRSYREIAEIFDISVAAVGFIATGRNWGWLK